MLLLRAGVPRRSSFVTVDGAQPKREYPASIDSSRVKIRYGDEGGTSKDGVIELRRGVADLDLGDSHYAQVRILVDGTHYLKGMAMYSGDMPDGADIVFNTNKHSGTPKTDVMKKIQNDPDNPLGAFIKANGQSYYPDPKGKYIDPVTGERKSLSAINKLKEEGDWDKMSKNLSSQFLSKQPIKLIQKQLDLTYADAADEFSEICSLNNPTIKRKLLMDFADECDSAVVHLKAAALPRQSTQVILPITKLKETEIYAPNYRNGEKVVLIRFPHGGTFEIPELIVNNKNQSAISILGKNIRDAVGINPKVAERLSGADFDGDQVVVIPVGGKVSVNSTPALDGLKDFDPKVEYSTEGKTGIRLLSKAATQIEMGMHDVDTFMFFKWFFKAFVAVFLVTHTFDITMAVFDVAQHVVSGAAGVIGGETSIDAAEALASMQDGLEAIEHNPARDVITKFGKQGKTPDPYTVEQMQQFMSNVIGMEWEMPVVLAGMYGLRMSEIIGLRTFNIDLEKMQFGVVEQMPFKVPPGTKTITEMEPTKSNDRILPITEETLPYFLRQFDLIERQKALIEASGGVYYDNKLFIAKPDGSPQRRDRMSANFGQLIRHLEMPHIRFHDLRHTAATNMHQLTGDFYTVGEILGHTLKGIGMSLGISTNLEAVTAQYVNVRLERKRAVLETYHKALHPQKPTPEPKKAKKKSSEMEL